MPFWRNSPISAGTRCASARSKPTLQRFLHYVQRTYGLEELIARLRDTRDGPRYKTPVVWMSVFWMFLFRLPSFHAWEVFSRHHRGALRKLLGNDFPGVDALGNAFSRMDCGLLRQELLGLARRLKRNKVLFGARINGFLTVAVDGHEMGASYKRCCPECLQRRVRHSDGERIQYYHRVVVMTVIRGRIRLPLDIEWVRKGEDEVAAALRLITRFRAAYPKFFQIVTADALYAQSPFFNALQKCGIHAVAVLKNEERELFREVERLRPLQEPQVRREDKKTYRLWDLSRLNAWDGIHCPVRVVVSEELTTVRSKQGTDSVASSTWCWVTTVPAELIDAWGICKIGHGRWEIENQGFNDWVTHWGFDHLFKHEPGAMDAILLTLLIAYTLFRAFMDLNLKPEVRSRWTARSLGESLRMGLAAKHIPCLEAG